jgi:pSer/pThr/pTyr-binding forkhead associated (FHA) protein
MRVVAFLSNRVPLKPGTNVLGRDRHADICVPDPHISRRHLVLEELADGSVFVSDLGSVNGLMVSGERVPYAVLRAGHEFQVGLVGFRLE